MRNCTFFKVIFYIALLLYPVSRIALSSYTYGKTYKEDDFWHDIKDLGRSPQNIQWFNNTKPRPYNNKKVMGVNKEQQNILKDSKVQPNHDVLQQSPDSKKELESLDNFVKKKDINKLINVESKNNLTQKLSTPTLESLEVMKKGSISQDNIERDLNVDLLPKLQDPVAPITTHELSNKVSIIGDVEKQVAPKQKDNSATPTKKVNNVQKDGDTLLKGQTQSLDSVQKTTISKTQNEENQQLSKKIAPSAQKDFKTQEDDDKNTVLRNTPKTELANEKKIIKKEFLPLKKVEDQNLKEHNKVLKGQVKQGNLTSSTKANKGEVKQKVKNPAQTIKAKGTSNSAIEDNEIPNFARIDSSDNLLDVEIDTFARPVYDYKNNQLPPNISKKSYGPNNKHIPKVFYQNEYSSLLFIAVKSGDIGAIKALLSKGANINSQDMQNGYTPMMYAIIYNKLDAFRYLMLTGADLSKAAFDGRTALHVAAQYNRLEMFKTLVSVGADLFAVDQAGLMPYELVGDKSEEVAIALVSQYENLNQALLDCTLMGATACVNYAVRNGANVNYKNMYGDSALTLAMNKRNVEIVSILILGGADIYQKNVGGLNAKDLAYVIGDQKIIDTIETVIVQRELNSLQ